MGFSFQEGRSGYAFARLRLSTLRKSVCPAFIECLDDYLSVNFDTVPELNDHNAVTLVTEPRPLYASLYMTHSVTIWFGSYSVSFSFISREQSERIG